MVEGNDWLRLGALICFTAASFGFLFFMLRFPRTSQVRTYGTRCCHVMGFLGVSLLGLAEGSLDPVTTMIFVALVISVIGFEVSRSLR